tara:strand:+ start:117 stop:377 length:261 start_codon:yes stop_codon:yes gene_type:complete
MEKTNKLIAEFMDLRSTGLSIYKPSEYKYHTSWDWLMPVANEIIKSRDEQNADWDLTDLKYALQTTNIQLVYEAVVKFIKDYNQNN